MAKCRRRRATQTRPQATYRPEIAVKTAQGVRLVSPGTRVHSDRSAREHRDGPTSTDVFGGMSQAGFEGPALLPRSRGELSDAGRRSH